MAHAHKVRLKKKYGQHFLRDHAVINTMLSAVTITPQSSLFEIGCGDCFLTDYLASSSCARLWVFEIDPEWAAYGEKKFSHNQKVTLFTQDFLKTDLRLFQPDAPWTLLANLPYQITFPLFHLFKEMGSLITEGVIMVQEEVAQKIVATKGSSYGFISLYFQHYFEWKLLDKVPPESFYPPPRVFSRLLYFKPKPLAHKDNRYDSSFWSFIKQCFRQPRRTLANNLCTTSYHYKHVAPSILSCRAQQLSWEQLCVLWDAVNTPV